MLALVQNAAAFILVLGIVCYIIIYLTNIQQITKEILWAYLADRLLTFMAMCTPSHNAYCLSHLHRHRRGNM